MIYSLQHKMTYTKGTCRLAFALFQPQEDFNDKTLIPMITGIFCGSETLRNILSLPARLGGSGIIDHCAEPVNEYESSLRVCQSLDVNSRPQHLSTLKPIVYEKETKATPWSNEWGDCSNNMLSASLSFREGSPKLADNQTQRNRWLQIITMGIQGYNTISNNKCSLKK